MKRNLRAGVFEFVLKRMSVFVYIEFVFNKFFLHQLFKVCSTFSYLRQVVDYIHHQMKAIHIIQHRHVEISGNRAFFFIKKQ